MKNKKILIIIPIILIILVLIGAGAFAFIYIQTDMFKFPKQLFFKYAGKSFEGIVDSNYYDEFLANYKTLSEKSYKSNGEISVEVHTDISDIKDVAEQINNGKINYNMSSIPKDEKYYMELHPTYNNQEITKLQGLAVKDNYGLKCTELYDKYVYVENNNLKSLAKKFGIAEYLVPERIAKTDVYDLLYIDKDTRKKIHDTYFNILYKKLDKKNFTKGKNNEITVNGETLKTNSYSLELTQAESSDIVVALLETLKNDDTTLDLIVEKWEKANVQEAFDYRINFLKALMYINEDASNYLSDIKFDKEFLKRRIQDEIDQLNNQKQNYSDENRIKLTVYSYNGNTVQLKSQVTKNSEIIETIDIQFTRNKNGHNIISLIYNNESIIKIDYTKIKENNIEKTVGTVTINSDSAIDTIDFNIESGEDLNKANIKTTLSSVEDVLETSQTTYTNDIVIEFNSETNGKLGTGTNNNFSYFYISSGNNSAKLNLKSDITYTDDIYIEDLNSGNGENLNRMSVSEIEKVLKEIIINFRKELPNKLELLDIDPSLFTNDEEVTENDDEFDENTNENNNSNENLDDNDPFSTISTHTNNVETLNKLIPSF